MPILDDEQFESYLKTFRPLSPAPLTAETNEPTIRHRFWANGWPVAAGLVLLAAALALYPRTRTRSMPSESQIGTEQLIDTRPLTIRGADALLFAAPSFASALDGDAFRQKTTPLLKNEHSAIAALSEENPKL